MASRSSLVLFKNKTSGAIGTGMVKDCAKSGMSNAREASQDAGMRARNFSIIGKPLAIRALRDQNNMRFRLHHERPGAMLLLAMNSWHSLPIAASAQADSFIRFHNLALHTKKTKRVGGYDNADLGRTNSVHCGGLKNSHVFNFPLITKPPTNKDTT